MKLIKLKDKFILVSDDEIKEGLVTNGVEIFTRESMSEYSDEYVNRYWQKIISKSPDFSLLSEEDCKTIGWVDVEKLAEIDRLNTGWEDTANLPFTSGFERGFKTVQSLNDKQFSLDDMRNMFILGGKYKVQNPDTFLDKMNDVIQSLQQRSWEVEVNELNQIIKII